MKTFITILFSGMIVFFGCSQSESEKTGNESVQEITTNEPLNPLISVTETDSIANTNTEESNASISNVSTPTSENLNPPHGEPGHRCDIPVGSPLNSAPSNATAGNTQVITPTQGTATNSATPIKTAPGMNPPHGEAGHDCTIPVGSPLKK